MKYLTSALFFAGLSLAAVSAAYAQAQNSDKYPVRTIRIIVGYTPGGSNDIVARVLGKKMTESFGQPVVVENRPSTGAIIGTIAAAKAAPDGYTLMVGATGPMVINPATYSKLAYSTQKDFVPISMIGTFPLILAVKADSKFDSIKNLATFTKENPKLSNYAASSSSFQLANELLKDKTGIVAQHIPYKGTGEMMHAVASGDVTLALLDPGPVGGAIKGKLIRGIAVTSPDRMQSFPDIPTFKEQGIDLEIKFWVGLFAPAGTPAHIVKILEKAVADAAVDPQVSASMRQLGLEPVSSTSKAFSQQIATELPLWSELAKRKNVRSD